MLTHFLDYNDYALLLIKLSSSSFGTYSRSLSHGISACIRIDNNISNRHLVSGIDYLIPSGVKENMIPFISNEVKKEIYFEDIIEIIPIGTDKLLITLLLNGEIYEAYCSSVKPTMRYGIHDCLRTRNAFINLSAPDIIIEHFDKSEQTFPISEDFYNSFSILSIEPYIEKDLIHESSFSDFPNPYSARQEYSYRNIDKISININQQRRTISIFDSFNKYSTHSDHDGGFETTEWTFEMSCTIKYGSIERLKSQLRKWEERGCKISNDCISFPHVRYWQVESILGIKFSFSNSSSTYPA